MTPTLPKPQLILDYKIFFGVDPPIDRISLIKQISKKSILFELVALNYRLKPKTQIRVDSSLETQIKELKYFTQTDILFRNYALVLEKYIKDKKQYPNIFNRQACLFAVEEIINSDEMHNIEDFVMARVEVWEAILKYLLAVNYAITQIKSQTGDIQVDFESLNPKTLPLNELSIETDPFFTPYRGYRLIDYFRGKPDFANEIENYFNSIYGVTPEHFIFYLLNMYTANTSKNPELNFFYQVKDGQQDFFDRLSVRIFNKEIHKLISIRKSPFIKIDTHKYLIADNSFLLEKAYSQFLNDFWFDWIKGLRDNNGKAKFTIDYYRSIFGYFFEYYLKEIIEAIFKKYKYFTYLIFDELKVNTPKGQIEIADIYLRYNNKILIGQVKSGSIYDIAKFGGDVDALYKNNRNKFFENFGVNQIIESIKKMDEYIQLVDSKFPRGHSMEIYPCIIINDKALQVPLMADIFNKRFKELITTIKIKKAKIMQMTLIHINDLEKLEGQLSKDPKKIWKLLEYNQRDKRFIPPFYITVNQNWNGNFSSRSLDVFISRLSQFDSEPFVTSH